MRAGLSAALLLAALAAPPAAAKSFTWAFNADVLTLDPHASNNTFTNTFLGNVYEALVRHNDRIEIEPALAESWERVSPTLWRFQLRRGVTFHNGEDLRRRRRGVHLEPRARPGLDGRQPARPDPRDAEGGQPHGGGRDAPAPSPSCSPPSPSST
jgi:hypothetical protein